MWTRRGVLGLLMVVLVACGGGDESTNGTTTTGKDGTKDPAPSTTAKRVGVPVVVGEPFVGSVEYPLPDQTGYSTVAIFKVRNPNDSDLRSVPFKVTVKDAQGKPLKASGGDDTFAIRSNEERYVVLELDVIGIRPASATVTVFAPKENLSFVVEGRQADSAQWKAENRLLDCGTITVTCDATADLTYTGSTPQASISFYLIIHQGSDISGPLVGGGVAKIDRRTVNPNETIPVKWNAIVDGKKDLPQARAEFYIESFDAS